MNADGFGGANVETTVNQVCATSPSPVRADQLFDAIYRRAVELIWNEPKDSTATVADLLQTLSTEFGAENVKAHAVKIAEVREAEGSDRKGYGQETRKHISNKENT